MHDYDSCNVIPPALAEKLPCMIGVPLETYEHQIRTMCLQSRAKML